MAISDGSMKVGRTLRMLRIALGKTQAEIAEGAGLDISYIGLLERDQRSPKLDTLHRIAKALGTTAADVLAAIAENE